MRLANGISLSCTAAFHAEEAGMKMGANCHAGGTMEDAARLQRQQRQQIVGWTLEQDQAAR